MVFKPLLRYQWFKPLLRYQWFAPLPVVPRAAARAHVVTYSPSSWEFYRPMDGDRKLLAKH